jgi:hypothetical protein
MANELYYQRRILSIIEDEGGYGYKTNSPMAGIPDLVVSHPDFGPAHIEVKMGTDTSTKLQQVTQRRMRAAGFHVVVLVVLLDGNKAFIYSHSGGDLESHGRLGWPTIRSAVWGYEGRSEQAEEEPGATPGDAGSQESS